MIGSFERERNIDRLVGVKSPADVASLLACTKPQAVTALAL
jgi:hypothetical protein